MTFRIPVQFVWCALEPKKETYKMFRNLHSWCRHVTCNGENWSGWRNCAMSPCVPFRWIWPPDKDLPMVICCYKYQHSNHGIAVYGYHTSTYSTQVVSNLYYETDVLVKLTTPSHLVSRLRMSGTYLHFPRRLRNVYRQLHLSHLPKPWPDSKPNDKNIYIKLFEYFYFTFQRQT
jgi:hypothetical protein